MSFNDFSLEDGTPWRLFEPADRHQGWAVLWLQGFTSTIEGHSAGVERISENTKLTFAMLEYAGHGNHPVKLENASRRQQFDEVVAVYRELNARSYDRIIVIGGSFGGYMAALLAAVERPQSIVLRAPANYKDEELEFAYKDTTEAKDGEEKDLYRLSIDENYPSEAIIAIRNFDGNTYVIEHGADEVISKNIPQSYFKAAQHGSYIVIPGLNHSPKQMADPEKYFLIVENWLETIIATSFKLG